jgi:hypothetical protein
MNAKILFAATAIAAIAAAASGIARADEADGSQFSIRFEGSRTRAEVAAEAARVPLTRSQEPAGSRVIAPLQSGLQTQAVRAQAIDALRLGKIPAGERSL